MDKWLPDVYSGSAEVNVPGGYTPVRLEYFEAGGAASAQLGWSRVSACESQPPTGSIRINAGAAYTRSTGVTLNLASADSGSGVAFMRLRDSNTTTWPAPRAYAASTSWTLPTGNGAKTVYVQYQDKAGNWSTSYSDSIYLDTTSPTATAPAHTLLANTQLGTSTLPVRISWSGSDTGSGIGKYQLQQRKYGGTVWGAWSWVTQGTTAASLTSQLAPGKYQFQLRAVDKAGNVSGWKAGAAFTVSPYQETSTVTAGRVSYSGTWTRQYLTSAYGSYTKYTTVTGRYACFSFTAGRQVAWVASRGSNRGYAYVYLDGVKVATVNLYSSMLQPRGVVFARSGLNPSVTHTLKVYVTGTKQAASAGTRVDIDGFVVIR